MANVNAKANDYGKENDLASPTSDTMRRVNLEVKVDEGGTRAQLVLPGLAFDDFDRTGNFSLWKVSKLFEFARFVAFDHPPFMKSQSLQDGYLRFLLGGNYEVKPEFYEEINKRHFSVPLTLSTMCCGIGQSSIVLSSEVRNTRTGQVYLTLTFKYVFVDKITRKPKVLPTEIREMNNELGNRVRHLEVLKPLKVPATAYGHRITVMPSHIDYNGHTNQSNYVKFCMDAATNASFNHFFRHFQGDICSYQAKTMQVFYAKESHLGAQLIVRVWEDPSQSNCLNWQILDNGRPVFYLSVEYANKTPARL